MLELSKGALDKFTSGEVVDQPILQLLNHKNSSDGRRYRLLLSDGIKTSSFTMLSPELNNLMTDGVLSIHSIVQIKRYAIGTVNHFGIQRRVMVILDMDLLVSGDDVGTMLCYSINLTTAGANDGVCSDAACQASAAPPPRPVRNQQVAPKASSRIGKIHSILLVLIIIVPIITLWLLQLMRPII